MKTKSHKMRVLYSTRKLHSRMTLVASPSSKSISESLIHPGRKHIVPSCELISVNRLTLLSGRMISWISLKLKAMTRMNSLSRMTTTLTILSPSDIKSGIRWTSRRRVIRLLLKLPQKLETIPETLTSTTPFLATMRSLDLSPEQW